MCKMGDMEDSMTLTEALTDWAVWAKRPTTNHHGEMDEYDERRRLERAAARAYERGTTRLWCEVHDWPLKDDESTACLIKALFRNEPKHLCRIVEARVSPIIGE